MLRKQEQDENKEKRNKKSRFAAHCLKVKWHWVNASGKPSSDTTYVKDTFVKVENKKAIELAHLSQLKFALKSAFRWEVRRFFYSAIKLALTNKCNYFWIIFDTQKSTNALLGQASTLINTFCQPKLQATLNNSLNCGFSGVPESAWILPWKPSIYEFIIAKVCSGDKSTLFHCEKRHAVQKPSFNNVESQR